jgi:tetratricopeptide (TPR) repeat protein
MQAEREELVKRVFPQLRKLCEARGVTWGEVDLRWGITDEQKAEGKVLPICLAEIHHCRPYFLGILGERYGWVPEELPSGVSERESWLAEHREKSVTELEMLHGVLNNPAMAEHAFFYLRAPTYVQALPAADRAAHREAPDPGEIARFGAEAAERRAADRRAKLDALKEKIRLSGLPVREGYADPKALGRLVLADLTAVIERAFPATAEPDPSAREAALHEAFARVHAAGYVGRQAYYDRLDAQAAGDGLPLVVVGDAGSGKSALLANWVVRYRATHRGVPVLAHFIGASPESTDWRAMVRRLLGELGRSLGVTLEAPDDPAALRQALANALGRVAARPRARLMLVVDGLNQLEDRDGAPDLAWLPATLPPALRLIVSTLDGRPRKAARSRKWPELVIERLESAERRLLIEEHLGHYRKRLSGELAELVANAPESGNPLYLRLLLEELRLWGDHQSLPARVRHYLAARDAVALFERILARYEADFEGDRARLVRDAMTLFWAARRGLAEAELLELLGPSGEPLPGAYWAPLHLAAERALITRSGLLAFSHDYLREAVRTRYLPNERSRRAAHLRLAEYFARRQLGERKLEELPWQLLQAREWRRLAETLEDGVFFLAAWRRNSFEVRELWTALEAGSTERIASSYARIRQHPGEQEDAAWSVAELLQATGHLAEALELWERLAVHYERTGDRANLVVARGNAARILEIRGELRRALELHGEAERLFRAMQAKDGLARALGNQANLLRALGDPARALELHRQEERLYRELHSEVGLQGSLGNQAILLRNLGESDAALRLLEEQERLCRGLGELDGLAIALRNRADLLAGGGDLSAASRLLEEAEGVFRRLGNGEGAAACVASRGEWLLARGDLEGSLRLHCEAERLFEALADRAGVARAVGNRAAAHLQRGELEQAWSLLGQQERLSTELGDEEGLANCIGNQALVRLARGDLHDAFRLLRRQEEIRRRHGDRGALAACLGNQAVVLKDLGDSERALTLHREEERICREIGDRRQLCSSLLNLAVLQRRRGELGSADSLLAEQEDLCRQLGNQNALQAGLGERALVLHARGDIAGARRALEQQERMCRELGFVEGLIKSLNNQAGLIFKTQGPSGRMIPLLDEAYSLAARHGFAQLAEHVAWLRSQVH